MHDHTDIHPHDAGERGQAATEFAIMLPALALLLMAIIAYGQMIWADMELTTATRDGARRAAVARTEAQPSEVVKQTVLTSLDSTKASDLTVTVTGGWNAKDRVAVTATRPWNLNIMGVEMWSGNLSSTSTIRIG